MQNDGFAEQVFHFGLGVASGNAAGQVGRIGGIAVVGLFDQDGVLHSDSPLSNIQPGLLQDIAPSSGCQVLACPACNGDCPRLLRVAVLSVTSTDTDQYPTILIDESDRVSNFWHRTPPSSVL